jgi:leucyl aminopeptidase
MWPMPLPEDLRKGLDSTSRTSPTCPRPRRRHADAGLFLREFVPDGVRWAHLDIAGPAFNEGGAYGYTPKGGTGAAVQDPGADRADVADGRLSGFRTARLTASEMMRTEPTKATKEA